MKLTKILLVFLGMLVLLTSASATLYSNETVWYYALEETGFNYADSTAKYNLTAGIPPTRTTGIINYGQDFSGTQGMTAGVTPNSASGSFSVWVNPSNLVGNRIFYDAPPGLDRFQFYFWGGGSRILAEFNGVMPFSVSETPSLSTWTHYVITWTPTAQVWYKDGAVLSTGTDAVSMTGSNDYTVGQQWSGGFGWDGDLDEISLFNVSLSLGQVNELYMSGSPNASAQYPFTAPPPINTPPTITNIANQIIFEDTSMTNVNFTIGDAVDVPTALLVTATSSNTGLVPNVNLFLSAVGENMIINATPLADQFGNTTINITVTDTGALTNSTVFNLEVLNVNDPPTITPINDKIMIEGASITVGFNVTDIDNLYTDLSYTTSFSNALLFSNYTFSNFNTSAQEYNLTANDPIFGKSLVNISVSDGEFSNTTLFLMTVNCNTSVRYNTTFNDPPTTVELQDMCYDIDVSFNLLTDILNYNYTDYGGTVNKSWIYVYKTTGGMNQELDYETSENLTATWYFDYSGTNPNDDFAVYGWGKFFNRTFVSGDTNINVFYDTYSQVATLNTFFSKSDGLMYALLILVLFATIGVASQSATLSLILSLVGLWLASKFVLDVPEEFLWISGALVLFIIWYIAKLRVD